MKKFWQEKYIGDYCFYFGSFGKGNRKFGIGIDDNETYLSLYFITFGFLR